jgi:hypothetical protein
VETLLIVQVTVVKKVATDLPLRSGSAASFDHRSQRRKKVKWCSSTTVTSKR